MTQKVPELLTTVIFVLVIFFTFKDSIFFVSSTGGSILSEYILINTKYLWSSQ